MHLFLSNNDDVLVGNFIADSVKGNDVRKFSAEIAKGILLHRKIDMFSDHHPVVLESIKRLRPLYHKYAGVAVDITYDHFLAVNFHQYASLSLDDFATYCYRVLLKNWYIIPWNVKLFLPFLIKHKRLQSYAKLNGISNALSIMVKQTSFPDKTVEMMHILKVHYDDFQSEFDAFFTDILSFVADESTK